MLLFQAWFSEPDRLPIFTLDRRLAVRPDGPGPRRGLEHVGRHLPPRRRKTQIRPTEEAQRSAGKVSNKYNRNYQQCTRQIGFHY